MTSAESRTGLRFTHADVPLLDRVRTALLGDDEESPYPLPEGYLRGGDGDRLRQRGVWQFEQQPPAEFIVALAQLRRLTVACPGVQVREHTEVPWRWTGTVPGVCDDDRPVAVTGASLTELAAAMESAVEVRASARAKLDVLRLSWGDSYQIWYAFGQWQARRRDGLGDLLCAPTPDGLYKLLTEDAVFCPVRPR
jgi:hypothetical protein